MQIQRAAALIEKTYLKKLQSQQMHTIRIIFHKNRFAQTHEMLPNTFYAYIKPRLFSKNFLKMKLGIISERLTRDLIIRHTRSSANSFPASSLILPSSGISSVL